MGGAGEQREHPARVGLVGRLSELLAVADNDGVDAEHRPVAAVDRARLPGRVLEGVAARLLDVVGGDDLERDLELREDRPALRRGGCEDDHRFLAAQISSAGHCRAHSGLR